MLNNVLIIDDEQHILENFSAFFREYNYKPFKATNHLQAINILKENNFLAIFLDLKFPNGIDGFEILKKIKEKEPEIPIIIITGYGDVPTAVKAMKMGVNDFILKPPNFDLILEKINKIAELAQNQEKYFNSLSSQLGKSKIINEILKNIDRASKNNLSILITGESGTGKTYLAKLIHDLRNKNDTDFYSIKVNPNEIEARLFGKNNDGLIYKMKKGTILLAGIHNMPLDTQQRLINFFDTHQKESNLKFITTSDANFFKYVKDKKFREDLFYRIAEFDIQLPPLRKRKEDIDFFAKKFLIDDMNDFNPSVTDINQDALAMLSKHDWPGNIRELRAFIRRTLTFTNGNTITINDLDYIKNPDNYIDINSGNYFVKGNSKKPEPLWRVEKKEIIKALKYTNGNKTETARILELNRTTLYNKLSEYNITVS